MRDSNKTILETANASVAQGNTEGFLAFCADDIEWTLVGDRTLKGKEAVRTWMAAEYVEPPKFSVENTIAEGDFLAVSGAIAVKGKDGTTINSLYCDVWRFRGGKMVALRAYVVKVESE